MPSLRDSFSEILRKLGLSDPRLVVLVGDISHFRLQPFAKDCPGRYYNVGICEPTIVNMAAGLSKSGLYPVVHTISPFIVERSFEQLKLDFCYQNLGGNIVTVGSAFDYANLGCTHHCYGDFALLKTLPNTQLFYPASYTEFDRLLGQVYKQGTLNYFRIPMYGHEHEFKPDEIDRGRAVVIGNGRDLTIVAVGSQLRTVEASMKSLQGLGVNPQVVYVHTVKPLDVATIRTSLSKTRRCLVIEEHSVYGGVFDDILRAATDLAGVRFASIAIPNEFIREYGTYEQHCRRLGFSVEGIVRKVKTALLDSSTIKIS